MEGPQVSAAQIASEIRARHHELRELMKRNKLWDPDVQFKRQEVRRYQLQLLFKFPSEKEAKDVDNQLWMTTSHAFIAAYKGLITALEREKHHTGAPPGKGGKPPKNVIEKRKLQSRFRQFLNAEEKFWRMFIARYSQHFDLSETEVFLQSLQNGNSNPEEGDSYRSLFPDGMVTKAANKGNDRANRLITLSKALVCLGDLKRYQEQSNEHKRNESSTSRGRGGHQAASSGRPTVSKAQEIYEIARSLVPDSGNSSHQLAILANYQKDTFAAVYHYYRALCVRHPYETAAENLQTTLNKALTLYLAKQEHNSNAKDFSRPPLAMMELLKEKVVVLHASWNIPVDDAKLIMSDLRTEFTTDFSSLISDRTLPVEIIIRTIVMGIGALWRIRLIRDTKKDARETAATEQHISTHLLTTITVLLRVGILQVSDGHELQSTPGGTTNLEFGITAVFRRMLPALRVSSKWVRAHLPYILNLSVHATREMRDVLKEFWAAYQTFVTTLLKSFPPSDLPSLSNPLEEDVDMCGFTPLKKTMMTASMRTASGLEPGQSQVHPNEEHLMRIADLISDALDVAKNEKSPIDYQESSMRFIFKGLNTTPPAPAQLVSTPSDVLMVPPSVASQRLLQKVETMPIVGADVKEEPDDDGATVSTRTDDDPVNLAMKATLEYDISDQEMEDDEIVYPKQSLITPINPIGTVPPHVVAATSPFNRYASPGSPTHNMNTTTPRKLSIQGDSLMSSIPDLSRNNGVRPPSLLFGSGTGETASIWSTSYGNATPTTFMNKATSPLPSPRGGWPLQAHPTDPGPKSTEFQANAPSNFMSTSFGSHSFSLPYSDFVSSEMTPVANRHSYQRELRDLDPFVEGQFQAGVQQPIPFHQPHSHPQRMWAAPP